MVRAKGILRQFLACRAFIWCSLHFIYEHQLIVKPSLSGSLPLPQSKNKPDHKGRFYFWCGQRESNPRLKLGKLSFCHYTMPADDTIIYYYVMNVQRLKNIAVLPWLVTPNIEIFHLIKCIIHLIFFHIWQLLVTLFYSCQHIQYFLNAGHS